MLAIEEGERTFFRGDELKQIAVERLYLIGWRLVILGSYLDSFQILPSDIETKFQV
jgi:hypothetical protein